MAADGERAALNPAEAAVTERFRAVYRLAAGSAAEAETLACEIALEQTVEVPDDCVPDHVRALGVIASVEDLRDTPGGYDVTLAFRGDLADGGAASLLNHIFGNVSLKPGVRLVDVVPTPAQVAEAAGPLLGRDGLRDLTGAVGRPLTATAIKPLGLSAPELAHLAAGYARGGLDIVKDDHGLIDQPFAPFEERVARCQAAVADANARTGHRTLYVPMVAGRFERLDAQMAFAAAQGVRMVMTAPLLIGLDTARALARRHGLGLMAHPSFAGAYSVDRTHGIAPGVLFGLLFRLFGADISIFPNAGGRFAVSAQDCRDIAEGLSRPMPGLAAALPAPAGGMSIERVGDMVAAFGLDAVLLIGGALMKRHPDPAVAAADFARAVDHAAGAAR